jgi:hypothetical protein
MKNHYNKIILLTIFLFNQLYVTAQQSVRKYATRVATKIEGIVAATDVGMNNTTDGNPHTYGSIEFLASIGSKQILLDFNASGSTEVSSYDIPANTPITIKIGLPSQLLGLLNGIKVQGIKNLSKNGLGVWNYDEVGSDLTIGSLISAFSGEGTIEVTIKPNASYQGIKLSYNGVSIAATAKIYDAYIMVPNNSTLVCSQIIDYLSGVRASAGLNVANITTIINNPNNAIDGNESTYSTISTGAQLLSKGYITALFNTPSKIGDSVLVNIADVNTGLIDLSLLSSSVLNFYNGDTLKQTLGLNNPSLISLRLLAGGGNIYQIAVVPNQVFDRVEVVFSQGVATALSGIRIYEIKKKNAPVNVIEENVYVYAGQSITFNLNPIAANDVVNYYSASTGGTNISNIVNTTSALAGSTLVIYTGTSRPLCTEQSDRKPIFIHVVGFSSSIPTVASLNAPYSSSIAIAALDNLPNTPVYNYATSSAMPTGLSLQNQTGIISGTPTVSGTFPIAFSVQDIPNNIPVGNFNYSLIISGTPLAITFATFYGKPTPKGNELYWNMSSANNLVRYIVQRSEDGEQFSDIASVLPNTEQFYQYTDKTSGNKNTFYRIAAIDYNNLAQYSTVITMRQQGQDASITLWPNPTKNYINISASVTINKVKIYNVLGQEVLIKNINMYTALLDLNSLPNGHYYIQLESEQNNSIQKQFTIVR